MQNTLKVKISLAILTGFLLKFVYYQICALPQPHRNSPGKHTSQQNKILIMTFNTHERSYDILSLTNKSCKVSLFHFPAGAVAYPMQPVYALKHGYHTYFCFPGNHVGFWYKLNMIENAIKLNTYDWLWWIDYDTLITNSSIALTEIINDALENHPKPDQIDLIFTPDCWPLNNGAMLIRSSPEILEWLVLLRACGKRAPELTEQDCMRDVLGLNEDVPNHPERSVKWASKLIMMPQRSMNSFPEEIKCHEKRSTDGSRPGGPWEPGDFVIHFAGSWAHLPGMEDSAGYLMNKYKTYIDIPM